MKKALTVMVLLSCFTFSLCFSQTPENSPQTPQVTNQTLQVPIQRIEYYSKYREPVKAVLYSTIIPGYGHIYNEQTEKFWIYFLGQVLCALIINEENQYNFKLHPEKYVFPRDVVSAAFIGFVVADKVDAYQSAKRLNEQRGYVSIKLFDYRF